MSIRTKQVQNIANLILAKYMQQGYVPTANTILTQLGATFLNRQPGTPQTVFTPFIEFATIDPSQFNTLTSSVNLDISTLYQEAIDQVNRIARNFDYKETFRKRIGVRIQKIAQETFNVQSGLQYAVYNILYSLAHIDIAQTDSFLDFETYTAKLPSVSNKVTRVPISNATLDWTISDGQGTVITDISNILTQAENSGFYLNVQSTTSPLSLVITITLPAAATLSNIDVKTELSDDMSIQCQIDSTTLSTQTAGAIDTVKWNFSSTSAQQIVLTFTKNIPDDTAGSTLIYYFGIKSVVIYYDEYQMRAELQTLPLTFPTLLGSLTLEEQTLTPKNTKVIWQYSLDKACTFYPIVPNVPTGFITEFENQGKRIHPVLTTRSPSNVFIVDLATKKAVIQTDTDMPILSYWRGNTAPLFNICRIPNNYIPTSVSVIRGRNSWKVEAYHYTYSDEHNSVPPSIKDIKTPRFGHGTVFTRFQPLEWNMNAQFPDLSDQRYSALRLPAYEYPLNNNNDRVMHVFSARISTAPDITPATLKALSNTVVQISSILSRNKAAIYLNGKNIPINANIQTPNVAALIKITVSLPLQQGDNYLQIVTDNYTTLHGAPFYFGDDVFSVQCEAGGSLVWYGDYSPLTKVSLFEMQYQTDRNDYSRYTIADDVLSDQEVLLVRELPHTVYDVAYKITDVPQGPSNVVLQAALYGDINDPSVTPVISDFTLLNNW